MAGPDVLWASTTVDSGVTSWWILPSTARNHWAAQGSALPCQRYAALKKPTPTKENDNDLTIEEEPEKKVGRFFKAGFFKKTNDSIITEKTKSDHDLTVEEPKENNTKIVQEDDEEDD